MKLKHVLFSGLLLSVGLTACTNDEFTEVQTPALNTEDGIALGEGITITGTKVANPATRAEVSDDLSSAVWETTDTIGAAWYNMITGYNQVTGVPSTNSGFGGGTPVYASNTWFKFNGQVGDDMSLASFKSEANLMAGAYVLYYPYDPSITSSAGFTGIPVALPETQTMDCTAGKELDAINENLFAYSVVPFVEGGEQTDEFNLKQVTNIFAIRFMVENQDLMQLGQDIKIKKVIIKADNGSTTILPIKGAIGVPTGNVSYADEAYGTTKFAKTTAADLTDQLVLDVANAGDDYAITGMGQENATKKPFYISALPFDGTTFGNFTVQILTDQDRVLSATYSGASTEGALELYNKVKDQAFKEGQLIQINVILSDMEDQATIYTAESFQKQWLQVMNGTKTDPMVIGQSLDLTGVTLPALNKDVQVEIQGAPLKVKDLNMERGALEIKNQLTVTGDLTFGSNAVALTTTGDGVLAVEGKLNVSGNNGTTNAVKVSKVANLDIQRSGTISIKGTEVTTSSNVVTGAIANLTNGGNLTLSTINITGTSTNSGTLTLGDNKVTNKGTLTNTGELALETYNFENNGTFNLNGTGSEVSGTGTFNNNAGATLNINTDAGFKIANDAATTNPAAAAAEINISGTASVNVTLTVDATNTLTNNGIVNVNAFGKLNETASGITQTNGAAQINVAKDGEISVETEITNGFIVVDPSVTVEGGAAGTSTVAVEINNANALNGSLGTTTNTLLVKTNLTVNNSVATILGGKNLVLYNNLTLTENLTMTSNYKVVVAGNVTVAGTETGKEFTLVGTSNEILAGATLTVGNNVTLKGSSSAALQANGGLEKSGTGAIETTNLNINY